MRKKREEDERIRTIHHMSIFPFMRSWLLGYQLIPLGTRIANSLKVAILIVANEIRKTEIKSVERKE